MKRRFMSFLASIAISMSLIHAKVPIKFGKVSLEELQMTQYDADTSAAAVVLCKYGYFNSSNFTFTLTQRVKILKKSGTAYSEFSFPSNESVIVRAKVFNLVDGKIEEEKVKNDNIYKERVTDNFYKVNIAIPNVKVGTVYDIEYHILGLPHEFSFQQYIPVKHAELIIEDSPYINFRKRMVGYLQINSTKNNVFFIDNVPAFKKEAYLNSADNYISKFEFDLLQYSFPGNYKSFSTSWESINKTLNEHDYFGDAIKGGSMYLSDIKKSIEALNINNSEKIKAAVEAIKKVQWNNKNSIYSSYSSLNFAFKDGKANSADINLMLLQLLKKLDIECYPVVLSTRANGRLNPFYPSYNKLNYVIVCAILEDKEILLDATEKYLPVGMIPLRCLNDQGRLVNENEGKWINLNCDKKDYNLIMYELILDEDLKLNGKIDHVRYDYAAYIFRSKYHDFANNDEYLTNLERQYPGMTIKDYNFQDINDIEKPVKETYKISISNKVDKVGNMLLINPFFYEAIDENPFKMDSRQYPVDFGYKREKMMISRITIPDNYQISEIPKPIKVILPDKSASAQVNYQTIGNTINITYRLKIDRTLYLMDEYAHLKILYKTIIEKHAEPIILKPIQDEASL